MTQLVRAGGRSRLGTSSKPGKSSHPVKANDEISRLIARLHETEQRLEELTAGEVDTVANRDGRPFLLQHAQEQLRDSEAARQAAILNALPAHIALLDTQGLIISVNEAWRRFASANRGQGLGVGLNYLEVCDSAQGDASAEAHRVAEGIRSVLGGEAKSFSIEYPCHSSTEQRWFLLTVAPLAHDRPIGAVVMHVDVTARKQTEDSLRVSESRFRQMAENISDVFFLIDADSHRVLYISPAYEEIWSRSRESLYANPKSWTDAIHPDDRASISEQFKKGMSAGRFEYEYRIVRPDGSIRWMEGRGFPVRDDAGKVVRITGIVQDITDRKNAADRIAYLNRVLAMLSGINSLQARVHDQIELFSAACRVAVEEGGFCMAWIGAADRSVLKIVPVASAGVNEAFLTGLNDLLSSNEGALAGNTVVARAMREKKVIVSNDLQSAVLGTLGEKHAESGALSMAILPLIVSDEAVGVLALYAREKEFFREEELKLLTSLASDIAFALEHMSRQQKIDKLSRIRAVSSEINAAIVRIHERTPLLVEACRIVSESGKFTMIWIGAINHDKQQVEPLAWKGFSAEAAHAVNWSSVSATKGTIAAAIQTGKASVRNSIEGELPGGNLRQAALKQGYRSSLSLPLLLNGRVAAVLVLFATGRGFFDKDEIALLEGVASDLSFALQAIGKQERLDYLAYYDVLTGLANRRLLLERMAQCMRGAVSGGHKLALYLIDLERFKNINDSLGQPAGDALLKQVAEWLTHNVPDTNLLARVGADHFAMALPGVKQEGDVARRLEKMMEAFQDHPFRLNDTELRISIKVGVALFPEDGVDADTLFKNAESALKKAKAHGDRYLFYTQKMTEAVAGKLTLENQLRPALDNEEFVLHYQPKVTLASGKCTSAEALLRWNDPQMGLAPPSRFIPVLEETGMIHEVGRWALRAAIDEHLRWRTAGLAAVRIAVNVSALQLRNPGFVAEIEQAIGIDPHAAAGLELEITESLIMEDVAHSIASLQAIRAMGITIAIDDFGTGFSSLSYLSKLPIDTLKIDRSFVNDMTASPEGLALVSTIITLAHSLKLKVVAEGVETAEQLRLLRLLDCDEIQGYLVSKPLPSRIFETRYLAAPTIAAA